MRASRRVTALALGLTVVIAAVVLGLFLRSSAPGPHWLRDTFDYKPAGGMAYIGGPDVVGTAALRGVSAASRDAAWVIGSAPCCTGGEAPRTLAWRWDGAAWRNVPMPRVSNAYPDLSAVVTVDSRDAWAVGRARTFTVSPSGREWPGHSEALIEHWDGSRWSIARTPRHLGASWLDAVSASGPGSVWAIGGMYGAGHFTQLRRLPRLALLLRWNGTTWRPVRVPWARPGVTLTKVVATDSGGVWVVASDDVGARVEYWNGTRWREIPAPFGRADPPAGFAATSSSDAWAVGSYALRKGRSFAGALAAHWNGSEWQIAPVPAPAGAYNTWLDDVAAVSPDDVWLSSFSLLKSGKHGRVNVAVLEHWDGRSWHITSGTPPPIQSARPSLGIGVAPDGTAWAIGANECDNVVLRWSGDAWQMTPHPADHDWTRVPQSQLSFVHRQYACTPLGSFPRPGPTLSHGPSGRNGPTG